MGAASGTVLQVFLFRDGEFLGTDMFSDRQVIVGRDPTVADLVLESSQVSRRHAILEQNGSTVLIRDAGSTNGIYLRNRRIDETELTRLDEVLLGDFSLKVKLVNKGRPEVASVAPTRVADAREFVGADEPSLRSERIDSDRVTRAEPPLDKRDSGGRRSEGSDWDDLEQELSERPSAPQAEFRDHDEIMDKGRFGEMLEDIGIARNEKTEAKPRPQRAKPARGQKKRRPQPEPRDSWAEEEEPRDSWAEEEEPRDSWAEEEEEESAVGDSDLDERSVDNLQRLPVDWDDDEDDEDANYVPPYSLVAQLLREDNIVNRSRHGTTLVEVLTLQGDSVAGAHLLNPGESFWVGPEVGAFRRRQARDLPPRVRLLKYKRSGECRVEMHREVSGTLKRGQKRIKLDSVDGMTRNARRGTTMMGFKSGEILDIVDGGNRYHIRYVSPPPPIRDHRSFLERLQPDRWLMRSFGGSVGAHFAALLLVYLFVPPDVVHSTLRKNDEFVEVTMEATPEIEEEIPEEPEEPEPEPEPEKAEPERTPPKQNRSKRRTRSGGTAKAPAGVLGLLNKKGSSRAPGPAAAVAAVSNLTAAKVPGASAGYRVSGLIGKLPSNSLSVGGGGGGLMTKGGAAILRGGGGGGGLARGKSRGVGGLVQKNPKAMRSVGQGHLDRDEIQKVINKNIGQIQRCYERELLRTPGLSGKVQVEWTIATSGRVRTARQTYTSIKSTNVSNCILGAIRGWAFPRPRGGEVIVNYPFIFKSIGF